MEIEPDFLLKDLKECFKRCKYRKIIIKVQNFIDCETDLSEICASFLVKMLLLQVRAVNKLLQKELEKKSVGSYQFFNSLLIILNRNLHSSYRMILNKIDGGQIIRTIYDKQSFSGFQLPCTFKVISSKEFAKIITRFNENLLESFIYFTALAMVFQLETRGSTVTLFLETLNLLEFNKKRPLFWQLQCQLYLSRALQEEADYEKSDELINCITEKLLQAIYLSNKELHRKPIRKEKHTVFRNKVFKMLFFAVIIGIRNKIKVESSEGCLAQIAFFKFLYDNTELLSFKRLLQLELHVFEEFESFCRAKNQMSTLIRPLFSEEEGNLRSEQKERESHKQSIMEYYNKKILEMPYFRPKVQASDQTQTSLQQENTKNRIKINGSKNFIKNVSNSKSCLQDDANESRLFHKFAYEEIDLRNQQYLSERQSSFISDINAISCRSSFFNHSFYQGDHKKKFNQSITMKPSSKVISNKYNRNLLSKSSQKIKSTHLQKVNQSESVHKDQHFELGIILTNKLVDAQREDKKKLKLEKLKLISRMAQRLQIMNELNRPSEDGHEVSLATFEKNAKEQETIKILENNCQLRQKAQSRVGYTGPIISKEESRAEYFIGLLLNNKEYLGLKKLADKIELSRKRAEFKEKNRHSRVKEEKINQIFMDSIHQLALHLIQPESRPSQSEQLEQRQQLIQNSYHNSQNCVSLLKQTIQQNIEGIARKKDNPAASNQLKRRAAMRLPRGDH